MCGITGFYSRSTAVSENILKQMTSALAHRGPNAEGIYTDFYNDRMTGLGHRRLSILDLSSSANQPFFSSCGQYVIVFNGEIYNYKELYQYLDIPLRTSGDTEVILELFIKKGPEFVSLLNGMFAFVIYNIREKTLWMYRDRLGVKPLFYSWINNELYFASEIKALKQCPALKENLTLNPSAIYEFLSLGYIAQPSTIYKQIMKFPSGSYAKISAQAMEIKSYWSLENKIPKKIISDEQEAKVQLKKLLSDSIRYRMISDVPLGTFLSGGIDSSIVTALAQEQSPHPVKTFSIGFKEQKFNESAYASRVAKYLGTEHHEYILSEQEAREELMGIMDNFDEPYADSSALPVYMVSRMARKEVTVVLTGDGGDECFLGYGSYKWAQRFSNPFVKTIRKPLAWTFKTFGDNRLKRIAGLMNYPQGQNLRTHIFSQEQYYFSESELSKLLSRGYQHKFALDFGSVHAARKLSAEEQQSFFDMNYYLKDDLLTKVDRASMLCSIEAREPMLDYKLVEFSLSLSQKLKMKGDVQKYLLKQLLYEYVPEEYFQRPKWGFSIPLGTWLQNELRYLIDDYLSEEKIRLVGILDYTEVHLLKQRFMAGEQYLYNRIWLTILLQKWMLKNAL